MNAFFKSVIDQDRDLLGKVRYRDYGTTAVLRIKDTLFTELGQE